MEFDFDPCFKIMRDMFELVEAVAHIGIDFGFGEFELTTDHIDKARHILEAKG